MSNSNLLMQGIDKTVVEIVVSGYLREILRDVPAPTDIVGLCFNYFFSVIVWKIPMHEIQEKLNQDFTTLDGPKFRINDHLFILKAKRSRNNLYLGAWYQCNHVIQKSIQNYFTTSFNSQIANKIIESFNFIIEDEEFDDVQLILHDMSDPTYSCILEHIENVLRGSSLLIPYGDVDASIASMKQNIIRILTTYNPGPSFIFRVRLYCIESGMEYRKLYRFSTHQVCEKGAEMYWRNKYNNYKDYRLGFDEYIKDKNELTLECYLDVINHEQLDCKYDHDNHAQNMTHNYMIDTVMMEALYGMKHGDHIYLKENIGEHGRFAVLIGYYDGVYTMLLQQLFPNIHNGSNVMVTNIKSVIMKINGKEYIKKKVRFDQEDDMTVCCKLCRDIWINNADDDNQLVLSVELKGII